MLDVWDKSVGLELSLITRQLFLSSLPGKQLENYLGHRNAELLLSALILLPDKKWEWVEKDLKFYTVSVFFLLIIFFLWFVFSSPWNTCWLSSHSCSPLLITVACERDNTAWFSVTEPRMWLLRAIPKIRENKKRNCGSAFPVIIFWLETPA